MELKKVSFSKSTFDFCHKPSEENIASIALLKSIMEKHIPTLAAFRQELESLGFSIDIALHISTSKYTPIVLIYNKDDSFIGDFRL